MVDPGKGYACTNCTHKMAACQQFPGIAVHCCYTFTASSKWRKDKSLRNWFFAHSLSFFSLVVCFEQKLDLKNSMPYFCLSKYSTSTFYRWQSVVDCFGLHKLNRSVMQSPIFYFLLFSSVLGTCNTVHFSGKVDCNINLCIEYV